VSGSSQTAEEDLHVRTERYPARAMAIGEGDDGETEGQRNESTGISNRAEQSRETKTETMRRRERHTERGDESGEFGIPMNALMTRRYPSCIVYTKCWI